MKSNEQQLIDIMFRVVMVRHTNPDNMFGEMSRDEIMEWVALQLECEGYPTQPMGLSWGVLKK